MRSPAELTTPVVLILFNRPELTQRVLAEIRRARPRTLFVIADGPRVDRPADRALCEKARATINEVDWPCEVHKLYNDTNLGCGARIVSGLDWVFGQTEEAIILEDDCIPTPSFFWFCQTLLERYRHDTRVMHIGGSNFQNGITRTSYSYFFSKYNHISGWATWRRGWRLFDHSLSSWPRVREEGWLRLICDDDCELDYWTSIFDHVHRDKPNVWGYAWTYACFLNGLSVYPSQPLVSHVGVGPDATHHRSALPSDNVPTRDIWKISHPPIVVRQREADQYEFDNVFGGAALRRRRNAARRSATSGSVADAVRSVLSFAKRKLRGWGGFVRRRLA